MFHSLWMAKAHALAYPYMEVMMLNFKITFKKVPYNNQYENVLRFDSREDQYSYFNIPAIFNDAEECNFNVESMLYTSLTYKATEDNLTDLLQSNYLIVQDNTKTTPVYYFYFITEAKQSSGNYINLKLELDIFQTYYIDIEFAPSEMLRAHLNRFVENLLDPDYVDFDGEEGSLLFKREPLNPPAKILTRYENIPPSPYYQDGTLGLAVYNWIKEYLIGWQYVFIDSTHTYTYKSHDGASDQTGKFVPIQYYPYASSLNIYSNISVLCFPVYKDIFGTHRIKKYGQNWYLDNASYGIENFANLNNDTSYVFTTKFSIIPPTTDMTVDGDDLVIGAFGQSGYNFINFGQSAGGHGIHMTTNTPSTDKVAVKIMLQDVFTFKKSSIIGSNKSLQFNPKLLGLDYKSIAICDTAGTKKEYDIQKLNTDSVRMKYHEAITPDITRYQINLFGGLYKDDNDICYNGLVGSIDNSILYSNDSYQSYLAANKNFYQQQLNQNIASGVTGIASGLFSSFLGFASGGALGGIGATVSGLGGGIGSTVVNALNLDMTVDNLRNQPDQIKNSNGSVLFNMAQKPLCLTAEFYDAILSDKIIANDYMDLYGYSAAGIIGDIKDYDNIRKYHNYIKCNMGEIKTGTISNEIERKFRSCFANGIRFWNASNGHLYDYDVENYENWLED